MGGEGFERVEKCVDQSPADSRLQTWVSGPEPDQRTQISNLLRRTVTAS